MFGNFFWLILKIKIECNKIIKDVVVIILNDVLRRYYKVMGMGKKDDREWEKKMIVFLFFKILVFILFLFIF